MSKFILGLFVLFIGIPSTSRTQNYCEYENSQKQYDLAEAAFSVLNANEGITLFQEKIQPCIDYWRKQRRLNDPSKNKEKKIWFQAIMNLVEIYFWMEDIEKATSFARDIIKQHYKKKLGLEMLNKITMLRKKN